VSELIALGASHRTAALTIRERLALPEGRAETVVGELLREPSVQEAVALFTCNRTELYLVVSDPVAAESAVLSLLARQAGIRPTELVDAMSTYANCDAARRVLIVGAGETAEGTAQALHDQGVRTLVVANRRRERARALAQRFGGDTRSFDALPAELATADIVIASTASPHTIVGAEELAQVMGARAGRPLLLIDLAVPRDIDPACALLDGVALHDIDDLQAQVARTRSVRREEARRAEGIVEEEIQAFAGWLGTLEVLPTVAALRARGDDIVAGVLAENAGRWEAELSPRDADRVEALAHAVANRLLHEPTLRLKAAETGRRHTQLRLLRELFGLADEEPAALAEPDGAAVHALRARR